MKRLSKSGIEYLDYQWGIFSGCENHLRGICGGGGQEFNCWAQSIAYRFKNHYPDGFNPHYYPEAINSPMHLKKPSIIGVGWVGDVIGYGLVHKEGIFDTIYNCPQHRFLFLTKNPEKLSEWTLFPPNVYVGVTACNASDVIEANKYIAKINATVKYLSIEPMQYWRLSAETIQGIISYYNWVILGSQTKPYRPPAISDVREIVEACDKAGIPVFLKDNLEPLLRGHTLLELKGLIKTTKGQDDRYTWKVRQEIPKGGEDVRGNLKGNSQRIRLYS